MARVKYGLPGIYNSSPITLSNEEGCALAVDANGRLIISGVASGAADSGNPVKIGGVYNSTAPTLTTGQRGDVQLDSSGNIKTVDAAALMKTIDSIEARPEGTTYINMSASALIRTGAGILVGMYVNSSTAGTIKFWDNTSAATTVINNTITPLIGWHNLGNASFATGLYATIANTLDVTVYYIPTP